MQPCYLNLLTRVRAVLSNRRFTGFVLDSSSLKCNAVSHDQEQTHAYEAGSCDDNVQKYRF